MSKRHLGATVPTPPMPGFVRGALAARGLSDAFIARPKYQQREYLVWIEAGKLNDVKRKRAQQMIEELAAGTLFLGQPWSPPTPAQ